MKATDTALPRTSESIVLFDGVCNMCNGAVNFIIDHERGDELRFTALQSPAGVDALRARGCEPRAGDPESIVLIEGHRVYDRSTAALRIARHLRGAWRAAYWLILVPRPLRDLVYAFIARNRYRWFGKKEVCRVPTPSLRRKFLA